jgi:hypothetical protein
MAKNDPLDDPRRWQSLLETLRMVPSEMFPTEAVVTQSFARDFRVPIRRVRTKLAQGHGAEVLANPRVRHSFVRKLEFGEDQSRNTAIIKTFAEVFNVSQIAVGGWTTCYCFQAPSEIN